MIKNKNSWDEWVAEDRVLKFNETNLSKQKQIEESFNRKNKASTGRRMNIDTAAAATSSSNIATTSTTAAATTTTEKGKKRRREQSIDKVTLS